MRILSFDIEEWFHLLDHKATAKEEDWAKYDYRIHENSDRILSWLEETKQKATFFCLGWIADKFPEIIRDINQQGHEIGSHTHLHQLIYNQTQQEFEEDVKRSIDVLQQVSGQKIRSFRAPGFSIKNSNLWALESLIKLGIEVDSSIFPASRQHGGIADFEIQEPFLFEQNGMLLKEFPINVAQLLGQKFIFSGGGYFRLFPYTFIKNLTLKEPYTMTYFHPRDFDPDQPIIEGLSAIRRFKTYYGLDASFGKLKKYMAEIPFTDIRTVEEKIDWEAVPRVPIGK